MLLWCQQRALVQKLSGCNHMKCSCGYQFCWLCGEEIVVTFGSGTSTCSYRFLLFNKTFLLLSELYPLHYKTGACAGLQMASVDSLSIPRQVCLLPFRMFLCWYRSLISSLSQAVRVVVSPIKFGLFAIPTGIGWVGTDDHSDCDLHPSMTRVTNKRNVLC